MNRAHGLHGGGDTCEQQPTGHYTAPPYFQGRMAAKQPAPVFLCGLGLPGCWCESPLCKAGWRGRLSARACSPAHLSPSAGHKATLTSLGKKHQTHKCQRKQESELQGLGCSTLPAEPSSAFSSILLALTLWPAIEYTNCLKQYSSNLAKFLFRIYTCAQTPPAPLPDFSNSWADLQFPKQVAIATL